MAPVTRWKAQLWSELKPSLRSEQSHAPRRRTSYPTTERHHPPLMQALESVERQLSSRRQQRPRKRTALANPNHQPSFPIASDVRHRFQSDPGPPKNPLLLNDETTEHGDPSSEGQREVTYPSAPSANRDRYNLQREVSGGREASQRKNGSRSSGSRGTHEFHGDGPELAPRAGGEDSPLDSASDDELPSPDYLISWPECLPLGKRFPYEICLQAHIASYHYARVKACEDRDLRRAEKAMTCAGNAVIEALKARPDQRWKDFIAQHSAQEVLDDPLPDDLTWHPNEEEQKLMDQYEEARDARNECQDLADDALNDYNRVFEELGKAAHIFLWQFLESRQYDEYLFALHQNNDLGGLDLLTVPRFPGSECDFGDEDDTASNNERSLLPQGTSEDSSNATDPLPKPLMLDSDGTPLDERVPYLAITRMTQMQRLYSKLQQLEKDKAEIATRIAAAKTQITRNLSNDIRFADAIRQGEDIDKLLLGHHNLGEEERRYNVDRYTVVKLADDIQEVTQSIVKASQELCSAIEPMFNEYKASRQYQEYLYALWSNGEENIVGLPPVAVRTERTQWWLTLAAIQGANWPEERKADHRLLHQRAEAYLAQTRAKQALIEAHRKLEQHHDEHIFKPANIPEQLQADLAYFEEGRRRTQAVRDAEAEYNAAKQAAVDIRAQNTDQLSSDFPNYSDGHYIDDWNAEIKAATSKTNKDAVQRWVDSTVADVDAAVDNDSPNGKSTYVRHLPEVPFGYDIDSEAVGKDRERIDKHRATRAEAQEELRKAAGTPPPGTEKGGVTMSPWAKIRDLDSDDEDESGHMISDQAYEARKRELKRTFDETRGDEAGREASAQDGADGRMNEDDASKQREGRPNKRARLGQIGNMPRVPRCTIL